MKSIILFLCIIPMFVACSKKGSSSSSSNTWSFAGTNYTASTVVYINGGSQANLSAVATGSTQSSANGLAFTFITPPAANMQMLITNSNDPNTVLVTATRLSGTTTTFWSNDITNVTSDVTLQNGKVGISFPGKIWLHNISDFNDSAQLSIGTITEQ